MQTEGTGAGSVPAQRFEIRGPIGTGGMGVVYRALDRIRGGEVAIKSLRHSTAIDVYRFKREFRSLADIAHPNLVTLYELHTVGDDWFFTMELVEGEPFLQHVRPHVAARRASTYEIENTTPLVGPDLRQRLLAARFVPERLESALYQLVDGVHALHLLGKLHRDLKPSNVLVESGGRVVLLDFGLVADINAIAVQETHDSVAVGTPAYMSPEQAADAPLTPASDWYSVGVILYEALTGRKPFDGTSRQVMAAKQREEPPPPHTRAEVPEHLDALCSALLRCDPRRRPDASQIFAALGRPPSTATLQLASAATPFLGRGSELTTLREALAQSRTGRGVAVFLRGASGMGKSALLRHFLDEAASRKQALVLEGRCYERESMPYKALDTAVDALASHLSALPARDLGAVLPRDVQALTRLFPTLRRVDAIAAPAFDQAQPPDPLELRRRAFAALRDLFENLAARQPVVLAIDDLQWGDADSAAFLSELIHHPKAPPVLLIASHRSEEETNPILAAIRRRADTSSSAARVEAAVIDISIGALSDDEAVELLARVGAPRIAGGERARSLVRDCGGNPFLLTELARASAREDEPLEAMQLGRVLERHVARLPADARIVLELCAVAARPLGIDLAVAAAQLGREGSAITTLRVERLVRLQLPRDGQVMPTLEPYHDRIRETVVAGLSDEVRRARHRALATALERAKTPDHEALVEHWLEAGAPREAAVHAAPAAVAAEHALAFHRAARLYVIALEHAADAGESHRLRVQMGHALVHAGDLDGAAAAFSAAAAGATDPDEALQLRRLDVEQRLRAGHLERGLEPMANLLEAVGYRMPRSRAAVLAAIVGNELMLRLRGSKPAQRATPASAAEIRRMQVLWSMASGVAFIQPVLGRLLNLRLQRDALASGDPRYLALAISISFGFASNSGGASSWQRCEDLRARGMALAAEIGDPALDGLMIAGTALAAYLHGHWKEAKQRFEAADTALRDTATGVRWQLDLVEIYYAATLWWLGETRDMVRLVPQCLREAMERGDRLSERGLRAWRGNVAWLVMDDPDQADSNLDMTVPVRQPGDSFELMHYYEMVARGQIALYRGHGVDAYRRVRAQWRELEASLFLRIHSIRVEGGFLRGRCALATAAAGIEREAALADAERMAGWLARENAAWSTPLAALLRAGVAHQRGDDGLASTELELAITGFAAADMAIMRAAAQRRLGGLLAGYDGSRMVAKATELMRQRAVADPEALTAMIVAGW